MKAAIYTRVSTFDQANGYSLDMQDKLAISYCQQHDIEVYKHYSDEITGAKMDRPSLRQLLADAENHCFNFVIVHKLDRLSRSQPVYIGKIRWRGELYQGLHSPIILEEIYYEAQPKIPITKKSPNLFRNVTNNYNNEKSPTSH